MQEMTHLAILGRQPELGLVELESVLGPDALRPFGRQALLTRAPELRTLGGVVKLAQVLWQGPSLPLNDLPLADLDLPVRDSKTSFGLSYYGPRETPRGLTAAGLTLKKALRARGGSYRFVQPSEGLGLSAAQVIHNDLTGEGFELVIVREGASMVIARTTEIQDIEAYGRRDHGRPARSAKVGMLPPKLAQILINTTHSGTIYDPFCGTGVVLQEALLAGRAAQGSDLAPEMIEATRTNLEWLPSLSDASLPSWSVEEADARTVSVPAGAAIVSEGYLGPNQSRRVRPEDIAALREPLLELYVAALGSWAASLPSGGEVSICAPAWRASSGWSYLGIIDELPRLGYTVKQFSHVRGPLLYSRGDQFVGRQLLLLTRN